MIRIPDRLFNFINDTKIHVGIRKEILTNWLILNTNYTIIDIVKICENLKEE